MAVVCPHGDDVVACRECWSLWRKRIEAEPLIEPDASVYPAKRPVWHPRKSFWNVLAEWGFGTHIREVYLTIRKLFKSKRGNKK